MKSCYVSILLLTVTLAYSAPLEYEYISIESTSNKPPLRKDEDVKSGNCCPSGSQTCCPYDYDDRCEFANNRTLCGYNKNQKKIDIQGNITIYGLPCRINDDRVECGYNGPYVTDPMPNPTHNPNCCNCCTTEATTTRTTQATTSATMTTTVSKTTEAQVATTEATTKSETTTKLKKLDYRSTKRPATSCVTIQERCQITYESPCILDPSCGNDYDDDSEE